jgi:hypothetical protein
MRPAHVGRLLLALGLLVGTAASVGLLVGFEPSRLPPALLDLAAYKLTFAAALGLLAGGATFLRYARRSAAREAEASATAAPSRVPGSDRLGLRQPAPPAAGMRAQPEHSREVADR